MRDGEVSAGWRGGGGENFKPQPEGKSGLTH